MQPQQKAIRDNDFKQKQEFRVQQHFCISFLLHEIA